MSVVKGLESAKGILLEEKVIKAHDGKESWERFHRERAIEAIDKAIKRYKSEALRSKKWQEKAEAKR